MDTGIDLFAAWAVVLLGVLLGAPYVHALWRIGVEAPAFTARMNDALRAGDLSAARMLCAAYAMPLGLATKAAFATALDGSVLRRDEAEDYRTAGATIDPAQLGERLEQTFVRAYDHARRWMLPRRVLAALGAIALAMVAAEFARREWVAPPAIGAAFALGLLLVAANRDRTERRRALAHFATLRPALCALAIDPTGARAPVADAAWTLVIDEPAALSREFPLVERVIKIGRVASSHVRLDHDSVARIHAVLENADDALTLIDLGAAGGTLVNGESVAKRALRDGDRITIGPCTITVRAPGRAAVLAAP